MQRFKVFLISSIICLCTTTMIILAASTIPKKDQSTLSVSVTDDGGAPNAEKRPPLTQEDLERIARQKQEYLERDKKNPTPAVDQENTSEDIILKEMLQKCNYYEKLQIENDQKAISTLSAYKNKSDIQKLETNQNEIAIMQKMLDVIKSGELEYTEIKPMILYMAARGDMIDDAFEQEIQKVVSPFLLTDPQLKNDIEVAYDPMYFGK